MGDAGILEGRNSDANAPQSTGLLARLRTFLRLATALAAFVAVLAPADASARSRHAKAKRTHKRTRVVRAIYKSVPIAPFSTVVIDAGHGGHDAGGIRRNIILEKDAALDVAKRLQRALARSGLRTVMTRADDRFIPLDQRVAIGNSFRDAIFMSIHFNSGRRTARGVETYYVAPTEATLASRIQRNLAATTTGSNRGVKRAGFRVLRNTKIRAVLAECGFLTNPQDVALVSNARYRQMLADQIARAIVEERNSVAALARGASPSAGRTRF
jgi:N-acetylmuramoyl-L-alanine amidase